MRLTTNEVETARQRSKEGKGEEGSAEGCWWKEEVSTLVNDSTPTGQLAMEQIRSMERTRRRHSLAKDAEDDDDDRHINQCARRCATPPTPHTPLSLTPLACEKNGAALFTWRA